MKLADKVAYYRNCDKYDRIVRQIRLRIYDYEDQGKLEKAHRIIRKVNAHNEQRNLNRRTAESQSDSV